MNAQARRPLVLVLLVILIAHPACVRGQRREERAYPTSFLWDEAIERATAPGVAPEELSHVMDRMVQLSTERLRQEVTELAQWLSRDGIVRSYRRETFVTGLGYYVEWYVRTAKRIVFLHNVHLYTEHLAKEGRPAVAVIFLDEPTAKAFEERIAAAKPSSLRSADGSSTADIYSFFSIQEGNSVWWAGVYNLETNEQFRQILLEQGGAREKRFIRDTETAAGIDRAFDWLRKQLEEEEKRH